MCYFWTVFRHAQEVPRQMTVRTLLLNFLGKGLCHCIPTCGLAVIFFFLCALSSSLVWAYFVFLVLHMQVFLVFCAVLRPTAQVIAEKIVPGYQENTGNGTTQPMAALSQFGDRKMESPATRQPSSTIFWHFLSDFLTIATLCGVRQRLREVIISISPIPNGWGMLNTFKNPYWSFVSTFKKYLFDISSLFDWKL